MIELLWKNLGINNNENMMLVTNLLAWFTTSLTQEKEYHKIILNGYMSINDNEGNIATLLIFF